MSTVNGVVLVGPSFMNLKRQAVLLSKLLRQKQDDDASEVISMGDIINWAWKRKDGLGETVRRFKHDIEMGHTVHSGVVHEVFIAWLEERRKENPRLRNLYISRLPASIAQIELLRRFDRSAVIHFNSTYSQAINHFGTFMSNYKDDFEFQVEPSKTFDQRWVQYENFAKPAISRLGNRVVHVHHDPTRVGNSLRHAVEGLSKMFDPPVDQTSTARALASLSNISHPIHHLIEQAEKPAERFRHQSMGTVAA